MGVDAYFEIWVSYDLSARISFRRHAFLFIFNGRVRRRSANTIQLFMKKLLFAMLAFATCSICAVSCAEKADDEGSSGGNHQNPSESPEDNLPEEARMLVGYWDITNYGSSRDFFLSADGRCVFNSENDYFYYWTYDTETKILATTYPGYQYQVTLSNEQAWAGILLNNNKPFSFERYAGANFWQLPELWINEDGESLHIGRFYSNSFHIDRIDSEDFTYNYTYYEGKYERKSIIRLINPHDLSKMYIEATGDFEGIYRPYFKNGQEIMP